MIKLHKMIVKLLCVYGFVLYVLVRSERNFVEANEDRCNAIISISIKSRITYTDSALRHLSSAAKIIMSDDEATTKKSLQLKTEPQTSLISQDEKTATMRSKLMNSTK